LAISKPIFIDLLVDNEVENLFTTISYLRQKAIASNCIYELLFTTTANRYSYKQNNKIITHQLARQVLFGYLAQTKGPPSSPKNLLTKPVSFYNNKVVFYPNGKISPGSVYLIDRKKKVMKALTCPISQVSFIRKYRYHKRSKGQSNFAWSIY